MHVVHVCVCARVHVCTCICVCVQVEQVCNVCVHVHVFQAVVIAIYTGARTAEAIVSEGINLARSTASERLSGKSGGVSALSVYCSRNTELY